ncbi:MAG TPA: zf-HC2 domain-containing protein [Micromonosporaceae bacterium]
MSCPQLVDSGVYVLGALSPAQRLTFERHMATCDECRSEVNDLAGLPGLLGRISEPAAVAAGELPPPTALPGVIAKVHRQRRGRRLVAVAAGLAVAVLALVAGLNMPSTSADKATTPVVASSVPAVEMQQMTAVDEGEPVTAQIGLTAVDAGTQVVMHCQYPKSNSSSWDPEHAFMLFAVPRSGAPAQQVDAWAAHPGQNVVATGMTAWDIDQIARFELRTSNGNLLLVYNVPS